MIPLTYSLKQIVGKLIMAIFAVTMIAVAEVINQWSPVHGRPISRTGWQILAAAPVVVGAAFGAALLLEKMQGPVARVVLGTFLIVLLSGILFVVKLRWLRAYAVLELLFAVSVTGGTMYTLGDEIQPVQVLVLPASAYLLIRGLDNFKKDLDERKRKACASHSPDLSD